MSSNDNKVDDSDDDEYTNIPSHDDNTAHTMNGQPTITTPIKVKGTSNSSLPHWTYRGVSPLDKPEAAGELVSLLSNSKPTLSSYPPLDGERALDLGTYSREHVTNCYGIGKQYFDLGLRLLLSYQHELASRYFLACLEYSPNCALAHGLISICHSPNYNFKGSAYYCSACHYDDANLHDLLCMFPSEQVADRHSRMAIEKIEELRKLNRHVTSSNSISSSNSKRKGGKHKAKISHPKNSRNSYNEAIAKQKQKLDDSSNTTYCVEQPKEANDDTTPSLMEENDTNDEHQQHEKQQYTDVIADVEAQLLFAIRILTCQPGIDADLTEEIIGRPYADAMAKVFAKYPNDPDIAYCYAESIMVLNAWELYDYPSGRPITPDVETARVVLELSLAHHPNHAGLCHMYVHLSEMSNNPRQALVSCESLRTRFPHAGHLIHMATHIDVLVGDYEKCYLYNCEARLSDLHVMKCHPNLAGTESFYFGYIVHNYHMGVYGAILGGMEQAGMELAIEINTMVNESMFEEYPDLVAYLEAYSALEIHVMIRFGRWEQILDLPLPKNEHLMLYRTASIRYGRALAYAMTGRHTEAKHEARCFDKLKNDPDTEHRILHNNTVAKLLNLDSVMMHGELLYKAGQHDKGLSLLKKAVNLQDGLNYDEPWGKMQPVRHAYGGLLYEQGHIDEAIDVFRTDLIYHPKNPWALVGLIACLKTKLKGTKSTKSSQGINENGNEVIGSATSTVNQLEEVTENLKTSCSCNPSTSSNNTTIEASTIHPKNNGKRKSKTKNSTTALVKNDELNESTESDIQKEILNLEEQYRNQRQSRFADFPILVPCECCCCNYPEIPPL